MSDPLISSTATQYSEAYRDPNVLIISKHDFNKQILGTLSHACLDNENEFILYSAMSSIFTTLSMAAMPTEFTAALSCYPQLRFGDLGQNSTIPDFSCLLNRHIFDFKQGLRLPFWAEVKPLPLEDWLSLPAETRARAELQRSLRQLNNQARSAFKSFTGDIFFCFLITGVYFTLLKYSRTEDSLFEATVRETPKVESTLASQSLPNTSTGSRGTPIASPRTPDERGETPPNPNMTPVKPATVFELDALRPEPIFHGSLIFNNWSPMARVETLEFHPHFCSALRMALSTVDMQFQPTFLRLTEEGLYVNDSERDDGVHAASHVLDSYVDQQYNDAKANFDLTNKEPPSEDKPGSEYRPPRKRARRLSRTDESSEEDVFGPRRSTRHA